MGIKEKIKAIKFSRLSIEEQTVQKIIPKLYMETFEGIYCTHFHYFFDKACVLSYSTETNILYFQNSWFCGNIFVNGGNRHTQSYELGLLITKVFQEIFGLTVREAQESSLVEYNKWKRV